MKKTLQTLIRLQRTEIDRLRQHHNRLLDIQDAETDAVDQIAKDIQTEQNHCIDYNNADDQFVSALPDFASYSQRMKLKRIQHEENLRNLAPKIDQSQNALTDAFAERKRYEIIQENREKTEQDTIKQKEQLNLDELTIVRYQHQAS